MRHNQCRFRYPVNWKWNHLSRRLRETMLRVFGPYNRVEWQMIAGVVCRSFATLVCNTPSNFHNFEPCCLIRYSFECTVISIFWYRIPKIFLYSLFKNTGYNCYNQNWFDLIIIHDGKLDYQYYMIEIILG